MNSRIFLYTTITILTVFNLLLAWQIRDSVKFENKIISDLTSCADKYGRCVNDLGVSVKQTRECVKIIQVLENR